MTAFTAADNLKAAVLMVLAMSLFAANDAIVKWLTAGLPTGEIMFLRGIVATGLLLVASRALGDRITVSGLFERWSLIRGAVEVTATYLFLTSIKLLPLATASTLLFAAPIFVTALSMPLFGERVGVWRWSAVVAGFVGVVIIAAPGAAGLNVAMAVPIAAAFAVSGRDIVTRFIPATVPSGSVAITSSVCVTFGGLATAPWGWVTPQTGDLAWIAGAATLLAMAYSLYVVTIRTGELSFTAPFKYVVILWAAVFGMIFWSEIPEPRAVVGAVIIIVSGLVIFYRERRLAALPPR
jgi:drug/metabolite transporter (DMT)-like permease